MYLHAIIIFLKFIPIDLQFIDRLQIGQDIILKTDGSGLTKTLSGFEAYTEMKREIGIAKNEEEKLEE